MSRKPVVCIIDDNVRVLSSLSTLLQVAGFNPRCFESAEDFLGSIDAVAEFACLVLDVRLPGMSGLELLEELNHRGITIPTILISGHANEEVLDLGLAIGAQTLFEKPFDSRKLIEAVTRAAKQP